MNGSFIILELQTDDEGHTASIINAYETKNLADNAYYNALAAAAISNVKIHAICMINSMGDLLQSAYYKHNEPTVAE